MQLPGLKATVSGIITDNQTITGCNDGTHGPHPISEWPQNCAPSAAEKLPAAEEDLLSSITVNELPESFVDDYIQDTAERKQLLKQHLKLKRPVEVSPDYLRSPTGQLMWRNNPCVCHYATL